MSIAWGEDLHKTNGSWSLVKQAGCIHLRERNPLTNEWGQSLSPTGSGSLALSGWLIILTVLITPPFLCFDDCFTLFFCSNIRCVHISDLTYFNGPGFNFFLVPPFHQCFPPLSGSLLFRL